MSIYNLSILFWLRKSRAKNDNERIIICRITVNGQQAEISTGEKIDPERWKNQSVIGNKADARTINERLDIIKTKIKGIRNKLQENKEIMTAALIKLHYEDKIANNNNKTLKQAFDQALLEMKELVDSEKIEDNTRKRYIVTYNNVKSFLLKEYKKEDIFLKDLLDNSKEEFAFARRYEHWGKTYAGTAEKPKKIWGVNYPKKELKRICRVLHIAIGNGWLAQNPFKKYDKAETKGADKALTEEAFEIIMNLNPATPSLHVVLDIFKFQCYTGLAYAEVRGLSKLDLRFNIQGYDWIMKKRKKTIKSSGKVSRVILLKEAQAILDKYKDDPECLTKNRLLPVRTNQEYNRDLKTIMTLANEKGAYIEHMTTHVGRHTCSRILMDKGLGKEFIAEAFGHTTTEMIGTIYGKVTTKKLAKEMDRLNYMEQELDKNKQIVKNI